MTRKTPDTYAAMLNKVCGVRNTLKRLLFAKITALMSVRISISVASSMHACIPILLRVSS